ncbi:MAG TPA: hypothetical protein GX511_05730, partial [Firmicutes bacterium]|nr:hypothetical protein [Bacillota bacterium]
RGLQGEQEGPLTAALLYVNVSGPSPRLDVVDTIRLYPREGRFELARTTIAETDLSKTLPGR